MRFSLSTFPLKYKTVLLRVDYNVPLEQGKVVDNYKIKSSLPTIKYLLQQNCKIILTTHLGDPEGTFTPELSTKPLLKELKTFLPSEKITFLPDCLGQEIKEKINKALPKSIFLLENLRFYKEEEQNNTPFAHALASLAEIYINDAFAASHRNHASLTGITRFLPAIGGILLETEISQLNKALQPQHPAIWIMGGAKLNKIDLLQQALHKADYILIGGALAFAFLRAQGIPVGMSKVDHDSVKIAENILHSSFARKIILPLDFAAAESISPTAKPSIVAYNQLTSRQIGLDLGPQTIELFKHYLRKAHTIIWNGPLGYFELAKFATATKEIGRFLGKLTATIICGGGETSEALRKFHLDHNITHLSTGGGTTLEFLSGKKLPGIVALEENYEKFKGKISSL